MQVHVKRVSNGFRLGGVYLFRSVASDGRNSEECQALAPSAQGRAAAVKFTHCPALSGALGDVTELHRALTKIPTVLSLPSWLTFCHGLAGSQWSDALMRERNGL